ncbi:MAG: MBL fold metallo-hydrolase [Verrucomicrobiales bacterium]
MFFRQIYDPSLAQFAYLIGCQRTGKALLIDPERDIDRHLGIAKKNGLTITQVTETHIHADFVSGSREFLDPQENVSSLLSDMGC